MLWWMLFRRLTEPGARPLSCAAVVTQSAKTDPGETPAVMSDVGAVVRFVRENVAREQAHTA
jgi:hypothetical protein